MIRERNGVWRIRSRSKEFPVDAGLGTSDLAGARAKARDLLDRGAGQDVARGTLAEAVAAYLSMPKKCNDDTAESNVSRLRSAVRVAFGAELDAVKVSRLPDLWHTYVARRQGRTAADYSARARINISINSAMKQAAAIFRRKLAPHYRRAGIILPADAASVEYLPAVTLPRPAADDAAMIAAWRGLRETDLDVWLVVGLARFAGLRLGEILACRGKWIEPRAGGAVVHLMDRLDDGHRTKTGRQYSALILDAGLAEYLLALDPDRLVIQRPCAATWAARAPQDWLRPFTGTAAKPLHRLRGLYADHLAKLTADAVAARLAGVRAAQDALGHTTDAATLGHYLTPAE